MNRDIGFVLQLIQLSFAEPRKAAEFLISHRLDRGTLWSIMGIVIALSGILFSVILTMGPTPPELGGVAASPFAGTLILGCLLVSLVFTLYFTGRMMGGTGHFPETIMVVAWHQAITLVYQVLQLGLTLVSPALGGLVGIIGMVFLFYVFLQFIDVLHGFNSLMKSFGTFAFALAGMFLGVSVILTIILGLAGATPQ